MMLFMDNPIAWIRFNKQLMVDYLRSEESNFHVDENGIIDRRSVFEPTVKIVNRIENVIFILSMLDIENKRYGKDKEIKYREEGLCFFIKLKNNL